MSAYPYSPFSVDAYDKAVNIRFCFGCFASNNGGYGWTAINGNESPKIALIGNGEDRTITSTYTAIADKPFSGQFFGLSPDTEYNLRFFYNSAFNFESNPYKFLFGEGRTQYTFRTTPFTPFIITPGLTYSDFQICNRCSSWVNGNYPATESRGIDGNGNPLAIERPYVRDEAEIGFPNEYLNLNTLSDKFTGRKNGLTPDTEYRITVPNGVSQLYGGFAPGRFSFGGPTTYTFRTLPAPPSGSVVPTFGWNYYSPSLYSYSLNISSQNIAGTAPISMFLSKTNYKSSEVTVPNSIDASFGDMNPSGFVVYTSNSGGLLSQAIATPTVPTPPSGSVIPTFGFTYSSPSLYSYSLNISSQNITGTAPISMFLSKTNYKSSVVTVPNSISASFGDMNPSGFCVFTSNSFGLLSQTLATPTVPTPPSGNVQFINNVNSIDVISTYRLTVTSQNITGTPPITMYITNPYIYEFDWISETVTVPNSVVSLLFDDRNPMYLRGFTAFLSNSYGLLSQTIPISPSGLIEQPNWDWNWYTPSLYSFSVNVSSQNITGTAPISMYLSKTNYKSNEVIVPNPIIASFGDMDTSGFVVVTSNSVGTVTDPINFIGNLEFYTGDLNLQLNYSLSSNTSFTVNSSLISHVGPVDLFSERTYPDTNDSGGPYVTETNLIGNYTREQLQNLNLSLSFNDLKSFSLQILASNSIASTYSNNISFLNCELPSFTGGEPNYSYVYQEAPNLSVSFDFDANSINANNKFICVNNVCKTPEDNSASFNLDSYINNTITLKLENECTFNQPIEKITPIPELQCFLTSNSGLPAVSLLYSLSSFTSFSSDNSNIYQSNNGPINYGWTRYDMDGAIIDTTEVEGGTITSISYDDLYEFKLRSYVSNSCGYKESPMFTFDECANVSLTGTPSLTTNFVNQWAYFSLTYDVSTVQGSAYDLEYVFENSGGTLSVPTIDGSLSSSVSYDLLPVSVQLHAYNYCSQAYTDYVDILRPISISSAVKLTKTVETLTGPPLPNIIAGSGPRYRVDFTAETAGLTGDLATVSIGINVNTRSAAASGNPYIFTATNLAMMYRPKLLPNVGTSIELYGEHFPFSSYIIASNNSSQDETEPELFDIASTKNVWTNTEWLVFASVIGLLAIFFWKMFIY